MKNRLLLVFMLVVFSFSFAKTGDISLYSSLTSTGTTIGGFRYDLGTIAGQAAVTDFSGNMQGGVYSYFADVYLGYWGISVAGNNTTALSDISLMLSAERTIADGVVIGIAVPLIKKTDGIADLKILDAWDGYVVIQF